MHSASLIERFWRYVVTESAVSSARNFKTWRHV